MNKNYVLLLILFISTNCYAQNINNNQFIDCGTNKNAQKLAQLIINDPAQQRESLVCSPLLSEIAAKKAKEMATNGRVRHKASNKRLIDAGYPLSRIYPRLFENNVEAIAGGISTAEQMWKDFKKSDSHRTHLLAEHEFYRLQNEIGAGFFKDINSPHI